MALEQEETKAVPRTTPHLVGFGRVLVFLVAFGVAIFAIRAMLQGGDRELSNVLSHAIDSRVLQRLTPTS